VTQKRERSVPKPSLLNTREDSSGTETERHYTYTITPESWENMVGILERRGSFDIDEAIARAGQRPVVDPKVSCFDALAMVATFPDHPLPGLIPITTRELAAERLPAVSLPDMPARMRSGHRSGLSGLGAGPDAQFPSGSQNADPAAIRAALSGLLEGQVAVAIAALADIANLPFIARFGPMLKKGGGRRE